MGARGRDRPALPPTAQPTNVIATELAFARAAREDGQWTAYGRFAASNAHIQNENGLVNAQAWLVGRSNPATADRWSPRQAWASCDGSAVIVVGISSDPAGNWSRFTRVWERQPAGDFRWVYTLSVPDPELTQARQDDARQQAEAAALGDNTIMVEAGNFIRAKVAECARHSAAPSPEAVGTVADGAGVSKDRTLRWGWSADEGGAGFSAQSWNGTGWDIVHTESFTPGGA